MTAAASPLAPRVEIVRQPALLSVRVRQPLAPRVLYALFLGFFLLGALAGLVAVASLMVGGRVDGRAATAAGMWLVALLFGVGFAAWAFFRAVLAREVVEVDGQALAVSHVAGPLRTGESYPLTGVRNLRHEVLPSPRRRGRGRRVAFAFDHGDRTVRFGYGVDGAQAAEVLAALHERVPGAALAPDHPKN
jgi:hypothetical protein